MFQNDIINSAWLMGPPLRSKDTDNLCGRFDKYCCLCAVYLGNEKKKCEVVSMLPHEQS